MASVRLRRVTSDDSCLMEWRASFEPPSQERALLERFVREDIIEAGFAGLRRALTIGASAAHVDRISLVARTGVAIEGVEIAITRYGGPEVPVLDARRSGRPAPVKCACCRPPSASISSTSIAAAALSIWLPPVASSAWRRPASSKVWAQALGTSA